MADKYHSDTQEKIETIFYSPGVKDSADLEGATKTITVTSEASGVGNADYSKALTLAKPDDARLVVKRIVSRLAVTIDSFDTATHLYCRVYVDAQDASHLLFDKDWDSTGAKLDAVDALSSALPIIYNLLKDGGAHTFYFFFWVNQANNAVISLVQLWEGVGSCLSPWYNGTACLELIHTGFVTESVTGYLTGSGTIGMAVGERGKAVSYSYARTTSAGTPLAILNALCKQGLDVVIGGSVATDLNYITGIIFVLRSEQ